MLFLIEYDRTQGKIVTMQEFDETAKAESARLEMELRLNKLGVSHEVVILEAVSESNVRRTHRRYFENLNDLAKAS